MSEKNLKILGWIGTLLSVIMYVSYVPQIMGNLHGNKTFFLQPLAATINCTIWTSYGLLKEKKDYVAYVSTLDYCISDILENFKTNIDYYCKNILEDLEQKKIIF